MKSVNKFAAQFLVFLMFLIPGYLVLAVFWGDIVPVYLNKNLKYKRGSRGHMYSRINEIHDYKNVDLLILGSSHAYRGFDPRIFNHYGYKTFVLGSSSQTPIQTNLILKSYLKELSPKVVIYEVYPGPFRNDGVESSLDMIANRPIDRETIKMAVKINHLKTYNTLIYGLYRNFIRKGDEFNEEKIKGVDKYIQGGYVERDLKFYRGERHKEEHLHLRDKQLKAFCSNLEILEENEVEIILVQAPITKSLYQSFSNIEYFDSLFNSTGYEYYNFNHLLIGLEDSLHFYDSHHLNHLGVMEFNGAVIEILDSLENK